VSKGMIEVCRAMGLSLLSYCCSQALGCARVSENAWVVEKGQTLSREATICGLRHIHLNNESFN